nr:PREDICTED: RCC1 and BTB domain-containing protein 1-like isoform X1 [Megachile rotundata]
MSSFELNYWPIFNVVDTEFISKIRMAIVYGNLGHKALMVTNDEMVYAIGTNVNYEADDISNMLGPTKIEVLCGKNIKTLAVGRDHLLALTKQGKVYSWGCNDHGQLGNGCYLSSTEPALVKIIKNNEHIVYIACGSDYSIALTKIGEVYSWGNIGYSENVPRQVQIDGFDSKVTSVACAKRFIIMITENGEVYSWGDNSSDQLRTRYYSNQSKPCKVTALVGIVIKKVVCGSSHVLALSSTGDLYVWGKNDWGQLGTDGRGNSAQPMKLISAKMRTVLDIAASYSNDISIAITGEKNVFIWGNCLGQCIKKPTYIRLKCVNEAFAYYAPSCSTYEPLIFDDYEVVPTLLDCFRNAFNDQTTSDLVIKVQGNPIYVHKAILKIRCPYLKAKFEEWDKNNESVIEVQEFSNNIYVAFLQYLYTNEINLSVMDIAELYNLANTYSDDKLKDLCMFTVKKDISVKNAIFLYNKAIEYKAKEIEEYCASFISNYITLIMHTQDFIDLNDSAFKTLLVKAIQTGALKK